MNAYRRGVDQPEARSLAEADTARYCRHMLRLAPARLLLDQDLLLAAASPVADDANSLFTFMAQRFASSYDILGCANLTNLPDPVTFTQDTNGVASAPPSTRKPTTSVGGRLPLTRLRTMLPTLPKKPSHRTNSSWT